MKLIKFFILFNIVFSCDFITAQEEKKEISETDKKALENIIVEEYYVAGAKDCKDETGGILKKGSITYRIYVDLKPGYSLQAVYGAEGHTLHMETTTEFFNNKSDGEIKGDYVDDNKLNENTVALDSWLTIGAATQKHNGVLRSDDKDGSIIKKSSLKDADGLMAGKVKSVIYVGVNIESFYGNQPVSSLITDDGSWAAYGGVKGPTDENRILIAQLTTDGKLTFEFNIQVGTPSGSFVRFVASKPQGDEEIQFGGLKRQ